MMPDEDKSSVDSAFPPPSEPVPDSSAIPMAPSGELAAPGSSICGAFSAALLAGTWLGGGRVTLALGAAMGVAALVLGVKAMIGRGPSRGGGCLIAFGIGLGAVCGGLSILLLLIVVLAGG
jgi:hypothetical protein